MKNFNIPFTNYDVFGYILPGALFSLGLLVVASDDVVAFRSKVEYLTAKSAVESVIFLLVIFAALYFIGHIIGCVGHLIFDRLIVRLLLGYPLYYILGWEDKVEQSLKTRRLKVFLFVVLCLFFLVCTHSLLSYFNRFLLLDKYCERSQFFIWLCIDVGCCYCIYSVVFKKR